jgi:beta-glucosidase
MSVVAVGLLVALGVAVPASDAGAAPVATAHGPKHAPHHVEPATRGKKHSVRRRSSASACPWVTSTASPAARAAMVVARMSISQLDDMVHRVSGPYEGNTQAIPSLCVPALNMAGGPDGPGPHLTGVTRLPSAVSAAATWDPATVEQFGAVTGSELAGKGVNVELGPTVNIVRDPRWGRAFESYGEDPYLSGQIAVADIQGVQGQGPIAMVKHFALYNQETYRNTAADDVIVSDRVAHEIYMPQFQAAVQQGGAGAVMCSYSTINGVDACQDPYLAGILDGQWGFGGFVMSDGGATHSTVAAANAGLEDMESRGGQHFGPALVKAVEHGQVALSTLQGMATRVLTTMFAFGLFNKAPTGSLSNVVTSPAHVAVARSVADEGTVLLKNDDGILPIGSGVRSIAVIGDDAGPDAITAGGGSTHVVAPHVVTPYQGIAAAAAGTGTSVVYSRGNSSTQPNGNPGLQAKAVAAARRASVAVVFAGLLEQEGSDLTSIGLSTAENDLISAVARANPNTVVVLNTGSAVTMPWLSSVKAVVEAWYPGQEDGDSIADILFGKVDPSGKLPVTFPVSLADVPASTPAQWPGLDHEVQYSEGLLVGYRWYDAKGIAPLFPFGFGLSYTTFSFSDLNVTPSLSPGDSATVTVDVTNTGSVAGANTVQAYVGDPASVGEPPEQLKGFDKVSLAPGQSTQVTMTLGPQSFSTWDTPSQSWVETPGEYSVMVGDSSANLPLSSPISIG